MEGLKDKVIKGLITGVSAGITFYLTSYIIERLDKQEKYCPMNNDDIKYCPLKCNDNNMESKNYTPLSVEVIDWIVNTGHTVVEVCAGNGENAIKLRDKGVKIYAYDVNPVANIVEYGVNGNIQYPSDAEILLICSGFDCMRAITTYKGKFLIIGGFINNFQGSDGEIIESLAEPRPYPIRKYKNAYTLFLRPTYNEIINAGWEFLHAWFAPVTSCLSTWSSAHCFYIFQRCNDSI